MVTYVLPFDILNKSKDSKLLKIKAVKSHVSNNPYHIIFYDKASLSTELIPTYGIYRSIIVNEENKVVSFAPTKSLSSDMFIQNNIVKSDEIIAEEFIEGTMINVFWSGEQWEIATKKTLSGNACFFKDADVQVRDTFYTMFMDAVKNVGLHFDMLDKTLCYSFILQHPRNRIVVLFDYAELYLIHCYKIVHLSEENVINVIQTSIPTNLLSHIKVPRIYENWDTYNDLRNIYASHNTPYYILGVMITNTTTGERCKIRNPVYEEVRRLRGNQPKLQYHYLCLRKEGSVKAYLQYYPEHKNDFSKFRNQLHILTQSILHNYVECYIKKKKPLIEYPRQYRPHMFNLHRVYVDELKEKHSYISMSVVISYINNLHPSQQMFWLNYKTHNQE